MSLILSIMCLRVNNHTLKEQAQLSICHVYTPWKSQFPRRIFLVAYIALAHTVTQPCGVAPYNSHASSRNLLQTSMVLWFRDQNTCASL